MALTSAQRAILKTDVEADPVLSLLTPSNANADIIKNAYNEDSTFVVWKTAASVEDIFNAINWKRLTPEGDNDPANVVGFQAISLACQGRQFNIQTMLVGRETINATQNSVRQGLNDALTQVPSGVNGATQAAGWNNVKTAMQRIVTRGEELFATGTGTAATPGLLTFEGSISQDDVTLAMGW